VFVPPDFCQGVHLIDVQNNLMWLSTVTNVPALLALRVEHEPRPPTQTLDPEERILEAEQRSVQPWGRPQDAILALRFGTPVEIHAMLVTLLSREW
jgi:hypothetical protein